MEDPNPNFLNEVTNDIKPELQTYLKWVLAELISGCFLIFWALLQYFAGKASSQVSLDGIDTVVFTTFRILFALATLYPIAIHIYTDLRIMWIRKTREIKKVQNEKKS